MYMALYHPVRYPQHCCRRPRMRVLKRKMADHEPEVEITVERKELVQRCHQLPTHFYHARLSHCRHGPTSALHLPISELKMTATKPDVETAFEWKSWRSDLNGYPRTHFYHARLRYCRHGPTSADIQNSKWRPKTGSGNKF